MIRQKVVRSEYNGFNMGGRTFGLLLTCGHWVDKSSWSDRFRIPKTSRCYTCEKQPGNRDSTMSELTDTIGVYVDRDGNVDPAEMWSQEDLRKLIKAAKAELKRRAHPTSEAP